MLFFLWQREWKRSNIEYGRPCKCRQCAYIFYWQTHFSEQAVLLPRSIKWNICHYYIHNIYKYCNVEREMRVFGEWKEIKVCKQRRRKSRFVRYFFGVLPILLHLSWRGCLDGASFALSFPIFMLIDFSLSSLLSNAHTDNLNVTLITFLRLFNNTRFGKVVALLDDVLDDRRSLSCCEYYM